MKAHLRGAFAASVLIANLCAGGAVANGPGKEPPMALGTTRPGFDFVTAHGEKPDWAKLRGKVVVMDFWATWCTPCIAAFPKMNALKKTYAGKPVVFYSVTYETPKMVEPLLARYPLQTEVAFDRDFSTFRAFAAWGIPAVYVFDRQGRLAAEVNPNAFDGKLIDAVLANQRPAVPQQNGWDDPKGAEAYFRQLRTEGEAKAAH